MVDYQCNLYERNNMRLLSREEYKRRLAEDDKSRERRLELQKRYHFPDWHLSVANDYSFEIADYIYNIACDMDHVPTIVECGCGLCNIIGDKKLDEFFRIGFDINETLLNAERELYEGKSISFVKGSFGDIGCGRIDFLISVNFPHEIPTDSLKKIYSSLFKRNQITYYIVDEVTGNYPYHHNYSSILPDEYRLYESIGPFGSDGGERNIRIFKHL
ncbi:MAG: hypothetical protein K6E34_13620 [Lachnospiraceae bacterium]|nr:hypothetical protein [Lachnospiraceae bacterium]